jgi:hypothetical protein
MSCPLLASDTQFLLPALLLKYLVVVFLATLHATFSENATQLHANLPFLYILYRSLVRKIYNRHRPYDCKLLIVNPRGPVYEEQFRSKLTCNHKNRCQPISYDLAFLQSIGLSICTLSVHLSLFFLNYFLAFVIHLTLRD